MKKIKVKNGEQYYFVDDDFRFIRIETPIIKKRTIYRVRSNYFSTKEPGDQYEVIRHMPFANKEDAIKYSLKELKRYKKYLMSEIKRVENNILNEKDI